jgi:hypothetical protein
MYLGNARGVAVAAAVVLLWDQVKLAETLPLHRRALMGREAVQGGECTAWLGTLLH